jgi:GPI mannosyltransferase 3
MVPDLRAAQDVHLHPSCRAVVLSLIDGSFLTNSLVPRKHVTEESTFYASPSRYLLESFPPSPNTTAAALPPGLRAWPSHLAFFASLLEEAKDNEGAKVKAILEEKGYSQVWSAWNGFDWAQDDEKRRGGVVVWSWVEGGKEKDAS